VAIDATPTDRIVPEDKRRNWVSDSKVLLELDSDHPLNFVQSEALKGFYKYDTDKNGKLEGDEIENAFGENAPALSRFQSEQGCLEDSEYVAAVAQFEKIDPPGMKLAQMFQATCQGDSNTFNAGWGKCPTYAKGYQGPGYKNHYWCPHDKSGGLSAQQVCPECGQCQPEQADKDNWDACGEPSGQCDGVCVAGVMDKIEAIPLVGAMVKKAREGACDAATLTSAAAHACNKATEYQDSGTICTLIGIVFGVDADGCEKILECITTFVDDTISNPRGIGQKHSTNTLGQCVDGFVDIIWGGIQKKLDLVQGAKDLAEQAPTDQELLNMVTPTIECPLTAENPIDKIVNAVKAIGQAIEALEDAMASVSDVLSQDPNNCKFSILVGLGVDFSFGPIAKGEEIGLYITLSKPDISSLLPQSGSSSRELDSKKMAAKLIKAALSGVEIGFYSASSFGYQTNLEVEAEAGLNYAVMLGDKSIWGGYGFELGLSVGLPNVGVGVELDMSLIFSAGNTDSSNNQIFRMIGFTFFLSLEVGVEVSPVSASIGCGLAATAELDFKNAIDQADKLQSSEIDWHNIGKSEQAKIFLPDDTCGDTGKAFTQSVENVQQQWESLKSNPNSAEHLMMEYEKCAEAVKCIGEGCKAEFEHYKNAAEETVKKCSNDISYSEECHSFVQDCSSGWQNSQGSTCLHCKKTSKGNCHTCYKTNPHGSCHSCEKTNPHGSCHSCQKKYISQELWLMPMVESWLPRLLCLAHHYQLDQQHSVQWWQPSLQRLACNHCLGVGHCLHWNQLRLQRLACNHCLGVGHYLHWNQLGMPRLGTCIRSGHRCCLHWC
jgi:hypothetical protein